MLLKKSIRLGRSKIFLFLLISFFSFSIFQNLNSSDNLEGNYTDIKVLDKISSKNTLIKLKNGEDIKYKDLLIKSRKCKNSKFDDNPEITAYLQVRDLTKKSKDNVYIFNGYYSVK